MFFYIDHHEGDSVLTERAEADECRVIEEFTEEEIPDPSAPIGIRREFRWTLPETDAAGKVLAFYLVHHYAEVYIDDALVYSLMPAETNRIVKTLGCQWVSIRFHEEDGGKEIRVVVTPVYNNVRNRQMIFQYGSLYRIYMSQLEKDTPQLLLSGICCILGVLILLAQLVMILRKRSRNWSIFFLGNFTALLGIWKLTDTRFSAVLFDEHAMLISYLTIGAIFLGAIACSLFLCGRFSRFRLKLLPAVTLLASGAALTAFVCQAAGAADFKQILPLAHIMIVLISGALVTTVIYQNRLGNRILDNQEWLLLSVLMFGVLSDLIIYYISGVSQNLVFTLLGVLVYTVLLFVSDLIDANRRAETDLLTGLVNKSCWDNLVSSPTLSGRHYGIIMLDLNRLKHVNDTMGHSAGDKMIISFANILRNTIPYSDTVCRWGGDEFTVLCLDATPESMEYHLKKVRACVDAYNASGQIPELHFAAGYALASEFPGLTPGELLKKADERMYLDKHLWYSENIALPL